MYTHRASTLIGKLPSLASRLCQIPSSRNARRIAAGAVWSLTGNIALRGLQAVSFMFLARRLGRTAFGEFGVIQSTIGVFGALTGFGLGLTATRFVAQLRTTNPERAGRVVGLSILTASATATALGILLLASAYPISVHVLAAGHLAPLLRLSVAVLVLTAINGAQNGILTGFEAFKSIAIINVITGVVSLATFISFAYTWGLLGAVFASLISAAVPCAIGHIAVHHHAREAKIPIRIRHCLTEARVLYSFSAPATLAGAMTAPVTWVGNAIIAHQQGGYAELGVFSAANTIRMALMFVPMLIQNASFPVVASAWVRRRDGEYENLLLLTHNSVNTFAIFLAVASLFLGRHLMRCFGPGFGDIAPLLGLMASVAIQAIGCVVGASIQVRGAMWGAFALNALWGSTFLAFVACTAPSGAGALAFGTAAAYLVLLLSQLLWQRRVLPAALLPAILGGLVGISAATALAYFLADCSLLVKAPVGFVTAALVTKLSLASTKRPTVVCAS